MQVRAIEFQENFARVPVEGARQQDLLQRSAEQAMTRSAAALGDQHVLEQNRPTAATQTENPIIDLAVRRGSGRPDGRRRKGRENSEKAALASGHPASGPGRHIDFVI